jgi:hypothetical protein
MDYVIETELPDGYHWFGGIITKKVNTSKGVIDLPVNFWTPYEKEALRFDNKEKAEDLNKRLLADCSATVVPESDANFKYSFRQIGNQLYIGAKRICNIQIGDSFVDSDTSPVFYKAVKFIENDTKVICKCYELHTKLISRTKKNKVLSMKSKGWIYVLYDTKQQKNDKLN